MAWEPIEAAKADAYRKAQLKQGTKIPDSKIFYEREIGRTLDIIARRVGLGAYP